MLDTIATTLNTPFWSAVSGLEKSLLPMEQSKDHSLAERTWHAFKQGAQALMYTGLAAVSTLPGALGAAARTIEYLSTRAPTEPTIENLAKDAALWEKVEDVTDIHMPETFLWGTATCEYQYSGQGLCPHSQWASFEKGLVESGAWSPEKASGAAHKHWERPEVLVAQLVDLGVTSYRFSVEWSNIQPQEGVFDETAIQHYITLVQSLKKNDIEPMITLHHFSEPQWFADKGGFENEENITHFTAFCSRIFSELHKDVSLWATINEPEVVAFQGYVMGEFPPAKSGDFAAAAKLLGNMLKAHCLVYEALKSIDFSAQVGIVHDGIDFTPKHSWNPAESIPCKYLAHITHEVVLRFLSTGEFAYQIPGFANHTFTLADIPGLHSRHIEDLTDWIGVNYYTRPLISTVAHPPFVDSTCYPSEAMTTYDFREDPAGLYEILMETWEKTGKPLYVTENGCPTNDDTQRERYIQRALYATAGAIDRGADVRGYFAWSLATNFEWGRGWGDIDFGLMSYDRDTETYTPRGSYNAYKASIARFKEEIA